VTHGLLERLLEPPTGGGIGASGGLPGRLPASGGLPANGGLPASGGLPADSGGRPAALPAQRPPTAPVGSPQLADGGGDLASTPPEKLKSTTEAFTAIRAKLEEAFDSGHYYSEDSWNFFHGGAWVNNIVTTIENGKDRVRHGGVAVATKFYCFLDKLLCHYPCYRVLHLFLPYFDRLEKVIAEGSTSLPAAAPMSTPQNKLLRSLAMQVDVKTGEYSLPKEALTFKDSGLDLNGTTDFLSCPLFLDYVTAITETRLDEAKKEKDPAKCCKILAALNKLPNLPSAWRSKIHIAIGVFDTSTTKATRIKYILQNGAAADLVFAWWPTGLFAVSAKIVTQPETLNLVECEWNVFREALELLVEADQSGSVEHTDYAALLAVVAATTQVGALPIWASALLRETCGLAFGVSAWQRGEARWEGIDFPAFTAKDKESFSLVLRHVRKMLATEIKGAPTWLDDLLKKKNAWKTEKSPGPRSSQPNQGRDWEGGCRVGGGGWRAGASASAGRRAKACWQRRKACWQRRSPGVDAGASAYSGARADTKPAPGTSAQEAVDRRCRGRACEGGGRVSGGGRRVGASAGPGSSAGSGQEAEGRRDRGRAWEDGGRVGGGGWRAGASADSAGRRAKACCRGWRRSFRGGGRGGR
jgi:hypothetical protein